jgi:hypothetical protein
MTSRAEEIRIFAAARCGVEEIAAFLGVSRPYVRHVMREWGYLPPTDGSYPDTPAKIESAERMA